MFDFLFDRCKTGARLKGAAMVIFVVGLLTGLIAGIVFLVRHPSISAFLILLLFWALVFMVCYIFSLCIYALGVEVENTCWMVQQDQLILDKLAALNKTDTPEDDAA